MPEEEQQMPFLCPQISEPGRLAVRIGQREIGE
jgi:hypothetical protein